MTASAKLKKFVSYAKKEALEHLSEHGIADAIVVKIKRMKDPRWLGSYRGLSQFKSSYPIFWVNEQLLEKIKAEGIHEDDAPLVITDTILHEYGHVIWEFLRIRSSYAGSQAHHAEIAALWDDIQAVEDDEEEFAENFAFAVRGRHENPVYTRFAKRWGTLLSKERGA